MKKLNSEEIKQVADALLMTEEEAKEITYLFAKILIEEQKGIPNWKIGMPLNDADDYIREWENHWHREMSWEEYFAYEKECCFYDYDNPEDVFASLESFKKYIESCNCAYQLTCSNMIAIVG